ncbi:unnamed protein product, partial [marine sediment metagenome]
MEVPRFTFAPEPRVGESARAGEAPPEITGPLTRREGSPGLAVQRYLGMPKEGCHDAFWSLADRYARQ